MPVHFDLGSPQSELTAAQIDGCFLTRGLCEYYQHCRCLRLPSIDKKHRPDTRKRSSGTQNSHGDWTYFEQGKDVRSEISQGASLSQSGLPLSSMPPSPAIYKEAGHGSILQSVFRDCRSRRSPINFFTIIIICLLHSVYSWNLLRNSWVCALARQPSYFSRSLLVGWLFYGIS